MVSPGAENCRVKTAKSGKKEKKMGKRGEVEERKEESKIIMRPPKAASLVGARANPPRASAVALAQNAPCSSCFCNIPLQLAEKVCKCAKKAFQNW